MYFGYPFSEPHQLTYNTKRGFSIRKLPHVQPSNGWIHQHIAHLPTPWTLPSKLLVSIGTCYVRFFRSYFSLVFFMFHLYFYHRNCTYIAWFNQRKLVCRKFSKYVAKAHDTWFLMKGAPPMPQNQHTQSQDYKLSGECDEETLDLERHKPWTKLWKLGLLNALRKSNVETYLKTLLFVKRGSHSLPY